MKHGPTKCKPLQSCVCQGNNQRKEREKEGEATAENSKEKNKKHRDEQ